MTDSSTDTAGRQDRFGKLIERAGPFTMRVASAQSPFEALVESIIYQQLHGKAAETIPNCENSQQIRCWQGTVS